MVRARTTWKVQIYRVAATSIAVLVLSLLVDRFPGVLAVVLAPGFIVAILVNMLVYGSLHEGVIPGYTVIAAVVNCLAYSAVVLLCCWVYDIVRQRAGDRRP